MKKDTREKNVDSIVKLLTEIVEDRTVPRNIRASVEEAKKNLTQDDGRDWDVRVSAAISILDEITNDPNIPSYTRTQIWNIVTMMEMIKS
ncbi:MAG: UPF0147 family protein [Candidatus Aenigmarchaeota archaeon]|nr:UPF0147 family protein [Candidatus Aenigmarchaeota archaeon]